MTTLRLERSTLKEIMDAPVADADAFRADVLYLKKTNRWFLNYWLIYNYLRPFIERGRVNRIADIGTSVADLPVYLSKKFRSEGIRASIAGIDMNLQVMPIARSETRGCSDIRLICSRVEDVPESFDIILASQMFHHLSPDEAVSFLQAVHAKAEKAVIISDLRRSRIAYWLVKCFIYISTDNAITRNDGPLSVLRCYDDDEIGSLLHQAGISRFKIANVFFRKFIIIPK